MFEIDKGRWEVEECLRLTREDGKWRSPGINEGEMANLGMLRLTDEI